jgi:hypothetical protein
VSGLVGLVRTFKFLSNDHGALTHGFQKLQRESKPGRNKSSTIQEKRERYPRNKMSDGRNPNFSMEVQSARIFGAKSGFANEFVFSFNQSNEFEFCKSAKTKGELSEETNSEVVDDTGR